MRARTARTILAAMGALAISTGIAVSATPAFADGSWIHAQMDDVTIAADGGSGKVFNVSVLSEVGVTNPVVTFDFSALGDIATPSFPDASDKCVISGSTATCDLPAPAADAQLQLDIPLKLTPGAGAHDGVKGTISLSATADGADPDNTTASVTVIDGPDLVLPSSISDRNAKPGDKVNLNFDVSNEGSQPAQAVLTLFDLSHGITPDAFDNCLYAPWPEDNGTIVLCEIDGPLKPGESWTIDPGLTGKIAKDSATFARADLIVDSDNSEDLNAAAKKSELTPAGAQLHFVKRASSRKLTATSTSADSDVDFSDNFLTYGYQVKTSYDIAGVGAAVHGSVGDTVSVKLGVKDVGPGSLDTWSSHDAVASYIVTTPQWAEALSVPKSCEAGSSPTGPWQGPDPGRPYYRCVDLNTYFLPAGSAFAGTFKLKIKSTSGKDGASALDPLIGVSIRDANHADDSAPITLVTGGGSGDLPVTGSNAGLIAGGGAVLVLLGGGLFVLGRRRRHTTAA